MHVLSLLLVSLRDHSKTWDLRTVLTWVLPRIEAMTEVLACIRYLRIANNIKYKYLRHALLGASMIHAV